MNEWNMIIRKDYDPSNNPLLETNTNVFPIPREGESINIVLNDESEIEYLGKVKKIEYYFNKDTGEKQIYVVVE